MKSSSAIKYRNLFMLVPFFCVLCLSPLADIHFEDSNGTRSYTHGQEHSEATFSMLIHELLFTHLQHTFDHLTLGTSHQTFKKNQNISSEKGASSLYAKAVCNSSFQTNTAYLQRSIAILLDPKRTAGTFSREYPGLSPPTLSC